MPPHPLTNFETQKSKKNPKFTQNKGWGIYNKS